MGKCCKIRMRVVENRAVMRVLTTIDRIGGSDTGGTTVNPDVMLAPYTAIDANGELITGTIEEGTLIKPDISVSDGFLSANYGVKKGYFPKDINRGLGMVGIICKIFLGGDTPPSDSESTRRSGDYWISDTGVIYQHTNREWNSGLWVDAEFGTDFSKAYSIHRHGNFISPNYVLLPDGVTDEDKVVFEKINGQWIGRIDSDAISGPIDLPTPSVTIDDGVVVASVTLAEDAIVNAGTKSRTYTLKSLYYGQTPPQAPKKGDIWYNARDKAFYRCSQLIPSVSWTEITGSIQGVYAFKETESNPTN